MFLAVQIAGVQLPWAMLGGSTLSSWLHGAPWIYGGGARWLRVGGTKNQQLVQQELRHAVRRIDDGATDLEVVDCNALESNAESVAARFSEALGLDIGPEQEMHTRLTRSLAARPRVFVLDATSCEISQLRTLERELDELRSSLAKRSARALLVAVVLVHVSLDDDTDELDVGGPVSWLFDARPERTLRCWQMYLHVRLAWESAGSVDRASEWEKRVAGVASGRDDALERALNDVAEREWELVAAPSKELARRILRRANGEAAELDALMRARLFWRPHGTSIARPVPWVARALLREGVPPPLELLRASLVCGPLLREAVGRCLDLEAFARAKFRQLLENEEPDPDATLRFAAFKSGRGADVQLYPAECPAKPTNNWDFAGFGAFLTKLGALPRGTMSALQDLRLLRNSLAHGHYVPWSAFERLREIEAALSS